MSSLCYPYGAGITCVCDEGGRIYKCFPEIKAEGGGAGGARSSGDVQGATAQGVQGGIRGLQGEDHDRMDRRSDVPAYSHLMKASFCSSCHPTPHTHTR